MGCKELTVSKLHLNCIVRASHNNSTTGGEEAASLPFILNDGLAPIPAKLVINTQKGDFVDMVELLRDNLEAIRRP